MDTAAGDYEFTDLLDKEILNEDPFSLRNENDYQGSHDKNLYGHKVSITDKAYNDEADNNETTRANQHKLMPLNEEIYSPKYKYLHKLLPLHEEIDSPKDGSGYEIYNHKLHQNDEGQNSLHIQHDRNPNIMAKYKKLSYGSTDNPFRGRKRTTMVRKNSPFQVSDYYDHEIFLRKNDALLPATQESGVVGGEYKHNIANENGDLDFRNDVIKKLNYRIPQSKSKPFDYRKHDSGDFNAKLDLLVEDKQLLKVRIDVRDKRC